VSVGENSTFSSKLSRHSMVIKMSSRIGVWTLRRTKPSSGPESPHRLAERVILSQMEDKIIKARSILSQIVVDLDVSVVCQRKFKHCLFVCIRSDSNRMC
jgi:hypothetical protein